VSDQVQFKNFSRAKTNIHFDIEGVDYDCVNAIGATKLQQAIMVFRNAKDDTNEENVIDRLLGVLKFFIKPESFKVFHANVTNVDNEDPVDMVQLKDLLEWLIEVYGMRPTSPSSTSSSSSAADDGGTSSTDGAVQLELTP
jgi:hypothetical protein